MHLVTEDYFYSMKYYVYVLRSDNFDRN